MNRLPLDNRETLVLKLPRKQRRFMAAQQRRAKKKIAKCGHPRLAMRSDRACCRKCGTVVVNKTPQQAADELLGTANSLDEVLGYDAVEMPREWLGALDELVLLCDGCGWWDDASEFDEGNICNDCKADA